MRFLKEVRKEDDTYWEGVFWIIADSVEDIFNDKFSIIGDKVLVDYNGKLQQQYNSSYWTHKQIWDKTYKAKYNNVPYNYYPRGRVVIRNGKAWINLPREVYLPQIIDAVVAEYNLNKLQIEHSVKDDSENQHYSFQLN